MKKIVINVGDNMLSLIDCHAHLADSEFRDVMELYVY